jgi:hypothetical protein
MSLQIYPEIQQGSDEWLEIRRGIITASVIGQLIGHRTLTAVEHPCPSCGSDRLSPCIGKRDGAPIKTMHPERTAAAKDNPTTVIAAIDGDQAHALALTIAAERIAQFTEPVFVNYDMLRGHEDEPRAVAEYERRTGSTVTHVGFMKSTIRGHVFGYSPDGLVGSAGLIECKSRKGKKHLSTMLADEVPPENMAQLQAGLMVSGREWCDYVSYCGGWPVYITRVTPDQRWQDAIADAVERFEETVEQMVLTYFNRYGSLPKTERVLEQEIF